METSFKYIINNITDLNVNIDVAFFPVDKRLEENFQYGGEFFIKKLEPKIFIPMHFWDDFITTNDFYNSQQEKNYKTKILTINHPNETLIDLN